jgi:acetyltransferase-like isoleucine patch superfamily enzyme
MHTDLKSCLKRLLACGLPDVALLRVLFRLAHWTGMATREVTQWLFKILVVEPTVRALCTRVGKRLRVERIPYVRGNGQIHIGDDVYLSGKLNVAFNTRLGLNPVLRIGHCTFLGHDCSFNLAREISIGNHCLIARGVKFYDNDGHPLDAAARRENRPVALDQVKPITIGDDVWIGAGSVILKGVQIAPRAIVGAGSMVTRDVPSDVIVGGNPARVIAANPVNNPSPPSSKA